MKKLYIIFIIVLFLPSCSWVTDFYIVNHSNKHIVITYRYKQYKNLRTQETTCYFKRSETLPEVCKEENIKSAISTEGWRTLKPDEYIYNKDKCEIGLTLAPGDAVKIDSACCTYTGPEESPGLSHLGSLIIKTSCGSIQYEGLELLKAFKKKDKTLHILYYR